MKKISLLLPACLYIGGFISAQENPNVLFISIDDLNDWVGCMGGHPQAISPNIDKLASEGTLFMNAHCQAPISGPSRASIMTGLYPSTSGNYLQLKDYNIKKSNDKTKASIFMPDYFEQFGYKTMGIGKIYHVGDAAKSFDEYGGVFEKFGPRPKERINYDPAWMGYPGGTSTDWGAFPEEDNMMPDHKYADWAIEKLKQDHDKPFFMAVGFVRPHVPWYVPQKWLDMFDESEMITPPYNPNDFDDIPDMARRVSEALHMPTTEYLIGKDQWQEVVQAYLACIAFVDHQVGKVLKALEESDYADNTIIVLWGDHGYHLGEKNRFAKQALWERDTKVPLIIKTPNGNTGELCNAPVQLMDIYPTLLDLCELPQNQQNDGHSLTPLIENPDAKWHYPALSFYGVGNITIRDDRYRLIQYEDGSQEYYDLLKDPNEWINLADKKKYSKQIKDIMKYIPENWSPLSKYSSYNFNEYFIEKTNLK